MNLDLKIKICIKSLELLNNNYSTKPRIYEIELIKKKFIQYSDVFPCDVFQDASFFTPLIEVCKNESFLEIGSGSGVTSVIKAKEGAIVTGLDINPSAIENSKKNAILHKVEKKCKFYFSELFDGIEGQKFHTIYWNIPFCSLMMKPTILERSIIDAEYKNIEKFFKNCKNYLNEGGRVLIGFSETIGDFPKLIKFLEKYGFTNFKVLGKKNVELDDFSFDLILYELKYKS
jgi:methylase of polypeptide subunit release factors